MALVKVVAKERGFYGDALRERGVTFEVEEEALAPWMERVVIKDGVAQPVVLPPPPSTLSTYELREIALKKQRDEERLRTQGQLPGAPPPPVPVVPESTADPQPPGGAAAEADPLL